MKSAQSSDQKRHTSSDNQSTRHDSVEEKIRALGLDDCYVEGSLNIEPATPQEAVD